MSIEKTVIVLMVTVVGILGTAVSIYDITAPASSPVAQFASANIIGPDFESGGVPELKVGQYAVITVQPEKMGKNSVKDIMVKSHLEDSVNGDYLYIDGRKIHPGVNEKDLDILGDNVMVEVDQFDSTGKTEPVMIKVLATDHPIAPLEATVNVILYADGKEIDRVSFDVVVSPRF